MTPMAWIGFSLFVLCLVVLAWRHMVLMPLRQVHAQQQRELAASKARMANVLNGSPDAIIGFQADFRIVFWNPAAQELFGLSKSDALGLSSRDLLYALGYSDDAGAQLIALRKALSESAVDGRESISALGLRSKDGKPLTVELSVRRHADDSDWAITVYVRDIAAHQQQRQQLEAAKQQLLDVTDNLPVAVYQFRSVGSKSFFPFANKYWHNMGLPPQLVMRDPSQVFVLNHPDDREGVRLSIAEAEATGNVWRKEMRIRFPDGNYRWMLGCSMPIAHPEGGVIFNGYWQDIHEAKLQALAVEEAQVAAETARQQLVDMTDSLPLTVFQFWVNHAGRIEFLFVGGNSAAIIGVETNAILRDSMQCWQTVLADELAAFQQSLQNALRRSEPFSLEHRIQRDGAVRWIRTHALPTRSASGECVWNGFWMDETESRSNMDAMRKAKELAEDATRTKSTFLATMSHEIRTPMNAIIGMSHLAMGYSMDPKALSFVEKVHRAGNNLLGIINDILDFSKIEADKLELEHIDFELDGVIDNVRNLLAMKAEEKGLELRFHVSSALPPLLVGDPLRIGQVLINLGNNAVKFTEHGFIDMGVRLLTLSGTDVELEFTVRDSGIGMTAEQCGRLFQAFNQADGSTTRKYGGTGLGLAISKRLVELMGGNIRVESAPGQGSSFHFRIFLGVSIAVDTGPALGALDRNGVRTSSSAMAADLVQSARASMRGLRLLLVEDNEMNQELATELLGGAGAVVTLAQHGAQALEILGSGQEFDGVLMDCQMPVMDGYTATRQLRENPAWKELPVIAMTANVMSGDLEKAVAAGMNAHVAKPLNVAEMFTTIAHWVKPREGLQFLPVDMPAGGDTTAAADQQLPALPGVDTAKGLAYADHNHSLYRRQLLSFLRNQADFQARLEAALDVTDWDAATRYAHTLKGTSGSIGAVRLQQASATLERLCLTQIGSVELQDCKATVKALLQEVLDGLDQLSPVTPGSPANDVQSLDAVKDLLRQLEVKCADSDPDAAELGSALLQASAGHPIEGLAKKLDRALGEFDFDEAQQVIEAMQRQLNPAQGTRESTSRQ